MNFLGLIIFFSGFLMSVLTLQGETLSWKTKEIEIPFDPALTEWVATYDFTNASSKLIVIQSIHSCCNCTTWSIDKMSYATGEKGTISLNFKTEGKFGVQQKMVTLTFEDGSRDFIVMKGVIPSLNDYLAASADPIQWKPNEDRLAKRVELIFKKTKSIMITSVKASDSRFLVKILHHDDTRMEVEITPPSSSGSSRELLVASLDIATNFPRKGEEVKKIILRLM